MTGSIARPIFHLLAGAALLAVAFAWSRAAQAQTVSPLEPPAPTQPALAGTATWGEPAVLPESAEFEATVLDVSRIDRAPELIGRIRIQPVQERPLRFAIPYDPALVKPGHRYVIEARITDRGTPMFATADPVAVFVGGQPAPVTLTLPAGGLRAAAELPPPSAPVQPGSGIGTATTLGPPATFGTGTGGTGTGSTVLPPPATVPPPPAASPADAGAPVRRIHGLYRALAGSADFVECGDNRSVPVASGGDNALLDSAYRRTRPQAGQTLLVELDGRIGFGPRPGGNGLGRVLMVDRFVAAHPGADCGSPIPARASAAATAGPDAQPLLDTAWRLLAVGTQPVDTRPGGPAPQLRLDSALPVFSGNDGCNSIRGEYTLTDHSLSLIAGPATRMACAGSAELEAAFQEALAKTATWGVTGDHLTLYAADGTALLRFTARQPG